MKINLETSLLGSCIALSGLLCPEARATDEWEFAGTYTVPSGSYMDEPVELAAPIIEWKVEDDGTIVLEYSLPYEIVGSEASLIKLQSVSTGQPLHLRGEIAEGRCRNLQNRMSCTIFYERNQEGLFPIDTAAGLAHMKALNLDAIQMATIMDAQETLMHEAVGILNFTLP